jgi:hypothetical protein
VIEHGRVQTLHVRRIRSDEKVSENRFDDVNARTAAPSDAPTGKSVIGLDADDDLP